MIIDHHNKGPGSSLWGWRKPPTTSSCWPVTSTFSIYVQFVFIVNTYKLLKIRNWSYYLLTTVYLSFCPAVWRPWGWTLLSSLLQRHHQCWESSATWTFLEGSNISMTALRASLLAMGTAACAARMSWQTYAAHVDPKLNWLATHLFSWWSQGLLATHSVHRDANVSAQEMSRSTVPLTSQWRKWWSCMLSMSLKRVY